MPEKWREWSEWYTSTRFSVTRITVNISVGQSKGPIVGEKLGEISLAVLLRFSVPSELLRLQTF